MGWFSSKKKIYVSSVVYNLAGGPEDRVRYLPSVISTKVISNTDFSMSETLQSALINGPGMRMRKYGQWARNKGFAATIGLSTGKLTVGDSVDINVLTEYLQATQMDTVYVQTAEVGVADYSYWVDNWMSENHPSEIDADYTADFDEINNLIYIRFGDPVTKTYQFEPIGFDPLGTYLYVSYQQIAKDVLEPIEEGTLIPIGSASEYPPVIGWDFQGTTTTARTVELATDTSVVVSYSDGRPDETTQTSTARSEGFDEQDSVYTTSEFIGENPSGNEITSLNYLMHQLATQTPEPTVSVTTSTETLPDGVVVTTTTTVTVENLVATLAYRTDTQILVDRKWSTLMGLIYKYGSGVPELDAMFVPSKSSGTFFPFIPMRVDNRFVGDGYYTNIYYQNLKALRKATGSKYEDLQKSLEVNPSLRDIDYAYVVFGVPMNTKENVSKKYLYKFFQAMRSETGSGEGALSAWRSKWAVADLSQRTWLSWKEAQGDPTHPMFGQPEPSRTPYPPVPNNGIGLYSPYVNYNVNVHWGALAETTGTGKAWADAKKGELIITQGAVTDYEELIVSGGITSWRPNQQYLTTITWQDGDDTWRSMGIWNLVHINMIYKGKGVYTYGWEAMNDPEESGLIIPLHEGIFREMSLVDSTQMSMSNSFMVLNCYQVVKQKWYQTSWFKIVLVVVVIVVSVLTGGVGSASAGLLGTAASVGAALGFAGAVAIIVGSIANAVAAMILTQILTMGASAIFGEKIGMIVGALASIIAINVGTGLQAGQSLTLSISELSTAENLMKLTVAAGRGISGYIDDATKATVDSTQDLLAENASALAEVERLWEQNLGFGNAVIDPTILTDVTRTSSFHPEPSAVFLDRTLMTGSDIAELTNNMLSNFVAMTITTQLPS